MTRKEAEKLIYASLEEIRNILLEYDPEHGADYFNAIIMADDIQYNNDYWSGVQKPVHYVAGFSEADLLKAEEAARKRHSRF